MAFEEKRVPTPRGEVVVERGQVWGSVFSMTDDVFAATGSRPTDRQARYAVYTLVKRGLVADHGCVHPETRGLYGKVYAPLVDEPLLEGPSVDVARAYRIYHYGDPSHFRLSEAIVGDPQKAHGNRSYRNRAVDGTRWLNHVAEHGSEEPAFTNVGRWRSGEMRRPDAQVFVPWLTADIDRNNLMVAWADATTLVLYLEEAGCDLNRCFVSYSGRRGFHVQVSADHFGSPIFDNSQAAAEAARAFFGAVAPDVALDACLFDPRQPIRLTGSRHERTGHYKRTWTAWRFLTMPVEEALADLTAHEPFRFPDPTVGTVEEAMMDHFEDAAQRASDRIGEIRRAARLYGSRPGPSIKRIVQGLSESETYGEKNGRNCGGFALALWLLEGKKTGDAELDALDPQEALYVWDRRNDPPMGRAELRRIWNNAQKKMGQA